MGDVSYRPLIKDMVWSYSRIETYNSCPYSWFLKYIKKYKEKDKFYASYGSFMHRLIERYYKRELTKEDMLEAFLSRFSTDVKGTRPRQSTVQKYIKNGSDYLRNFQPFDYKMIDVEKQVNFVIDDIPFIGYIDYLGEKNGEYYIIDNKSRVLKPRSGRIKPTVKDKELDTMLKQLYLYSAAIYQEYGKFPKSLCFNCFRTGIFIEEQFSKEVYSTVIDWAKKKIKEIEEADEFYPNVEFFLCNYICGVSEDCCYYKMTKEERGCRI